ncbi:hypothetical protein JVU11DRAFT_10786 [Chiua virens]|nr:hypothetical protein JVU11DRAFT_10786 [Chiua virens]
MCSFDPIRELGAAHEHIKFLEAESLKLRIERDTLRELLDRKLVIDPALSSLTATRLAHPNIQFWTVDDFERWLTTPEAQNAMRGKEPYLEEEDRQGCFGLSRCAENGWKLDCLARSIYPAWRAYNLDEHLKLKTKSDKKISKLKRAGTQMLDSAHPKKKVKRGDVLYFLNRL